MVFLVGRRVIIEGFWATTILPPINGFFFCVQCGSECSEIFWVSWSKKKIPSVRVLLGNMVAPLARHLSSKIPDI